MPVLTQHSQPAKHHKNHPASKPVMTQIRESRSKVNPYIQVTCTRALKLIVCVFPIFKILVDAPLSPTVPSTPGPRYWAEIIHFRAALRTLNPES